MKEDFLHYIWKFQKLTTWHLATINGESLKVLTCGEHNKNAGPDFFNGRILIGSQLWAGNIEIHIRSSDWYVHQHQNDPVYDNIVLHVVWEHDTEIFRNDNSVIPTLELKSVVESNTLKRYYELFSKKHKWINCEQGFADVDEIILNKWLERLYVERLEQKSKLIRQELKTSNNHWEALLFKLLCKNFGLKVNSDSFLSIARSVDYSTIQKCTQSQLELESLLFGQAGLLEVDKEDGYFKKLQTNYAYLKHKFNLENKAVISPKFFRLRPPNFPTVRISQFARMYAEKKQLFSDLISDLSSNRSIKSLEEFYLFFNISASEYWDEHYNFGVASTKRKKTLTKKFINLLLINTIIPLQFCYAKYLGRDVTEAVLDLASAILKEENAIVEKYNELKPIANTAFESQALLQLKSEYCDKMRCLECAIGNALLK